MKTSTIKQSPDRIAAWKLAVGAASLWLVGCTVGGMAVATANGSHGSIVFVFVGFAVGVAGAIAHGTLLLSALFRRQSLIKQVGLSWAVIPFLLLLGSLVFWGGSIPLKEWLVGFYELALIPSLVASFVFNWIIRCVVNREPA